MNSSCPMPRPPALEARFGGSTRVLRGEVPLSEQQIRQVAPSVFEMGKHARRSERYTHVPTIEVLRGLRREGFEAFLVAQGQGRVEGRMAFARHMIRLRRAGDVPPGPEGNEIVLINSHDGASSFRMLAGVFRLACGNNLVVGDAVDDIRIAHKGDAQGEVIEAALRLLDSFERVNQRVEAMKRLSLTPAEQIAFARAALALRFGQPRSDDEFGTSRLPPVRAEQLDRPRRREDVGNSLWASFQRVQENALRGGLLGRTVRGRRIETRPVAAIDRTVALNRRLWDLAEAMLRGPR